MITLKTFEVNYFAENCYVLSDETKEAVVIDCGLLQEGEMEAFKNYVETQQLKLKHLLVTHLHLDHNFGNNFMKTLYGLSPEASALEVEQMPPISQQAVQMGLPNKIIDVSPKATLIPGKEIYFGNTKLMPLSTPGHTPGGISFYCEAQHFVISGDSLFCGSIGRTDLWGGDQETLVKSIQTQLMTLPKETIVYPGHGPETTIENERTQNPYI